METQLSDPTACIKCTSRESAFNCSITSTTWVDSIKLALECTALATQSPNIEGEKGNDPKMLKSVEVVEVVSYDRQASMLTTEPTLMAPFEG